MAYANIARQKTRSAVDQKKEELRRRKERYKSEFTRRETSYQAEIESIFEKEWRNLIDIATSWEEREIFIKFYSTMKSDKTKYPEHEAEMKVATEFLIKEGFKVKRHEKPKPPNHSCDNWSKEVGLKISW